MRIAHPTSLVTTPAAPIAAVQADGACVAASERARGGARDQDDDGLQVYRDHYRETAYYSTGRDWQDYAPAYRCGLDAFAARRPSSQRFGDVESSLANAWATTRGDSRLGWAEARGAVMDAWLRQCDARSVGVDRRRGVRRAPGTARDCASRDAPVVAGAVAAETQATDAVIVDRAAAFTDAGRGTR